MNDFYTKYLKYKNKYLKLKQLLKGGSSSVINPMYNDFYTNCQEFKRILAQETMRCVHKSLEYEINENHEKPYLYIAIPAKFTFTYTERRYTHLFDISKLHISINKNNINDIHFTFEFVYNTDTYTFHSYYNYTPGGFVENNINQRGLIRKQISLVRVQYDDVTSTQEDMHIALKNWLHNGGFFNTMVILYNYYHNGNTMVNCVNFLIQYNMNLITDQISHLIIPETRESLDSQLHQSGMSDARKAQIAANKAAREAQAAREAEAEMVDTVDTADTADTAENRKRDRSAREEGEEVDEEEAERCAGLKKEGNLRELCLRELALRQVREKKGKK
jgi:hypothetical protein